VRSTTGCHPQPPPHGTHLKDLVRGALDAVDGLGLARGGGHARRVGAARADARAPADRRRQADARAARREGQRARRDAGREAEVSAHEALNGDAQPRVARGAQERPGDGCELAEQQAARDGDARVRAVRGERGDGRVASARLEDRRARRGRGLRHVVEIKEAALGQRRVARARGDVPHDAARAEPRRVLVLGVEGARGLQQPLEHDLALLALALELDRVVVEDGLEARAREHVVAHDLVERGGAAEALVALPDDGHGRAPRERRAQRAAHARGGAPVSRQHEHK